MADYTAALVGRLLADSNLAALVGDRIHWGDVPQQSARPYVRLSVTTDPRPEHLKGYDAARVSRVQADCFAQTYGAARLVSEAIVKALAAPAVFGAVRFGRTKAEGPRDLGERVTGIGYVHRASVDLLVEHGVI